MSKSTANLATPPRMHSHRAAGPSKHTPLRCQACLASVEREVLGVGYARALRGRSGARKRRASCRASPAARHDARPATVPRRRGEARGRGDSGRQAHLTFCLTLGNRQTSSYETPNTDLADLH